MSDLNKTKVTHLVTATAAEWLDGLGAKAVETEVAIKKGWIADLAAFWVPTPTEAIKQKLIKRRPDYSFGGTKEERETDRKKSDAWLASFRALPDFITIVHEVKTSRADFRRDTKWTEKPVAHVQVVSYLKGIIADYEIPGGWWGLEHAESGKLLKVRCRAPLHEISERDVLGVVASLADRLHNRQANKFFKKLREEYREQDRKSVVNSRLGRLARMVFLIARGEKTVDEAIYWNLGGGEKIDRWTKEELEKIHGVLKTEAVTDGR